MRQQKKKKLNSEIQVAFFGLFLGGVMVEIGDLRLKTRKKNKRTKKEKKV